MTDALVEAARESIAKGSKSFAAASTLFDKETAARAWLLYAWCRHCDDVIDGQELGFGTVADPRPMAERLSIIRAGTEAALKGETTGEMAFDALGRVAAETGMPARYPMDLIAGFAMDADETRYERFEQTLTYCYHVAGCVGVMMAIVMGVDPHDEATLDRACDLGISFQLNNIARDLAEDDARGRCYVPAEWGDDRVANAKRLVDEAERYEASARCGTPALSFRSAWAVLAAAGIYGDIGRRVRALGARAWDERVTTSRADKIGWVVRAGLQAATRRRRYGAPIARAGLWSRASGL
ncbi:MAG: phytoene/squalene synthase family protein [Alphaproteobacteria bacterium]|nr:phytoene/squalene synthase family protein [Alphaproteobacteria bacterium]